MLKTKKYNLKGMSFVEVIIAIFIFAVVMFAVMMIFTSSFGGYKKADNMAKNIENAQFAMNSMAKSIRTSKIMNYSGSFNGASTLITYDFSENACKEYVFSGTQILARSEVVTYSDTLDCSAALTGTGNPITDQSVSGVFFGSASIPPSPGTAGSMGKVTIKMKICSDSACAVGGKNDQVILQTTVSLRDYTTVGL